MTAPAPEVIWHEVECGSYSADLPLWRELAAASAQGGEARVLDLGAGIGRVSLDLAAAGHSVTALDVSPALLGELARRADGLPVRTVVGDARDFRLDEQGFDLCLVPMQTLQLLRDDGERRAMFENAATHLRSGALMACAIVTAADEFDAMAGQLGPSPDRLAVGERVYFSRPLSVRVLDGTIRIERERVALPGDEEGSQRWRGAGERDVVELACVTEEQLWREAATAGLAAEPTLLIAETDEHTASEVVVLRA
jgi:SAM-dependent methyltransferase